MIRFRWLCTITFLFIPFWAMAADYNWNNVTGGDFATAANWTPAGPPGSSDRAILGIPLTDTIHLYSDTQTAQLLVDLADVSHSTDINLNLENHTYTLHHVWTPGVNDPAVVIGDSTANTRLAAVHGVFDIYDCIIARGPSSMATLAVLGDSNSATDERWTAFQHAMIVGDFGNGSLWIDHGAVVEHGHGGAAASVGGIGHIIVQDANSLWHCTGYFGLGQCGRGYLEVKNGASARIGRCVMGEVHDDSSGAYGLGSATISGANSTWELLSAFEVSLVVGREGDGSVTVQNQAYLHNFGHVTVAETKESYGELFVLAGGEVEIEKSLSLGHGIYKNDDCKALVHVEGTDSQLIVKGRGAGDPNNPDSGSDFVGLLIGKSTSAKMEVVNYGYAANSYITLIGGDSSGSGEIVVDGMDARFDNKYRLEIGHLGKGQLNIANGGVVAVTAENNDPDLPAGTKGLIEIGQLAPGYVYVGGHDSNGAPSTLTSVAQIKVGVENYGQVEVVGGARVESHPATSPTNSAVVIGATADGEGLVTVRDAGSLWNHEGTMNVGWYGKGTLEITDGGRVESGYGIVARCADSTGVVTVAGENSVWAIGETLIIGGTAMDAGGTGNVTVSDFGEIQLPIAIKIWEGSLLAFDPTAVISAEFIEMAGGMLVGSGTLLPDIKVTSLARLNAVKETDELIITGKITDVGDLLKEGSGVVVINGDAHYEGLTIIAEGTLCLNGSLSDLHDIVGGGNLSVGTDGSPSMLTATNIQVNTLTIGLAPQDAIAVPEPTSVILLLCLVPVILVKKRKGCLPNILC